MNRITDYSYNGSNIISFLVSEEEKKLIKDHILNKGLNISEFTRESVFLNLVLSGNLKVIRYITLKFFRCIAKKFKRQIL